MENHFKIIQSDDSHLLLEYNSSFSQSKDSKLWTNKLTNIFIANHHLSDMLKQPELPVEAMLIGIPPAAKIKTEILDVKTKIVKSMAPVEFFNNHAVPELDGGKAESMKISSSGFCPSKIVTTSDPFQWRYLEVVRLKLFPIQYNLKTNEIRFIQSIRIKVNFLGSYSENSPVGNISNSISENIEKILISNYSIAKKWKIRPTPSLGKKQIINSKSWIRIPIHESGIHVLDYSFYQNLGYDSTNLVFNRMHILSAGGRPLSEQLSEPEPELVEACTQVYDANHDGLCGKNDYLIFFAQSTNGWNFDISGKRFHHNWNPYANENIYWLGLYNQPRKKMKRIDFSRSIPKTYRHLAGYWNHVFGEKDRILPGSSGTDWMWNVLRGKQSITHNISVTNPLRKDSAYLSIRLKGLSEEHHFLEIYFNHHLLASVDLPYKLGKVFTFRFPDSLLNTNSELSIRSNSDKGMVGFDWYEMTYWSSLNAIDNKLDLFATDSSGWATYNVAGFTNECPKVFDISDPFSVKIISAANWDSTLGQVTFADSIKNAGQRYLIVSTSQFLKVREANRLNYDLLGHLKNPENSADYVIIIPKDLVGSAITRFAEFRRYFWTRSGGRMLNILVVTLDEIYNQFSWGLRDPVGIRNFLRYAFRNWKTAPEYVLLVGNATYDVKDNLGAEKKCLVPSFEHENTVSDDWFVNLTNDRAPDMLIGRLPVKSRQELSVVIDKIIQYESKPTGGPWRSRIILAADDIRRNQTYTPQDSVFMRDSEKLANSVNSKDFDIEKIYLEQFPPDRIYSKPAAKKAFLEDLNTGALYVNYFGHANWNMMAHENLFRTPADLSALHNQTKLPIFFAGSCEIARIDDPLLTSMSEYLLTDTEGGNIATIGSARWTIHQASYNVGSEFYRLLLDRKTRGKITVGQALVASKILAGFPDQTEAMFLIGDPALRLPISNKHIELSIEPDSLSLRKRIYLRGSIRDSSGVVSYFNGLCHFRLYDSNRIYHSAVYYYTMPGKILFEGETPVKNGRFETSFFASADTALGGANSQIAASAWTTNNDGTEKSYYGIGKKDSIIVVSDSLEKNTARDTIAPDISLFINGMPIDENSTITLSLPCKFSGNLSDEGSGFDESSFNSREFEFQIDGKVMPAFVQNAKISFNSPNEGHFESVLSGIALGSHKISIQIFDRSLNLKKIDLNISIVSGNFTLSNVLNYPNPARNKTFFTFELSQDAAITVKIYTISGRCIRELQGYGESGFNHFPEDGWSCTDEDLDRIANGVYLYKVTAKAIQSPLIKLNNSDRAVAIGKLVIVQ